MLMAIMDTKGETDTFQNSPIHLLFYEKITKQEYTDNILVPVKALPPEIFSMSSCHLKEPSKKVKKKDKFVKNAYKLELQIVLSDFTAWFVTAQQYKQLLFVLGQQPQDCPGQSCKEVLTLLNNFPTHTPKNFKDMMYELQLPFMYNENDTLAENRCDFKNFFLGWQIFDVLL